MNLSNKINLWKILFTTTHLTNLPSFFMRGASLYQKGSFVIYLLHFLPKAMCNWQCHSSSKQKQHCCEKKVTSTLLPKVKIKATLLGKFPFWVKKKSGQPKRKERKEGERTKNVGLHIFELGKNQCVWYNV